jgi:hypothetical protein
VVGRSQEGVTADRLQRRGMDHPERCPLCDQDQETLNHMLLGCIFAREFWFKLLLLVNLQHLAHQSCEGVFMDWWQDLSTKVPRIARNGLNSLVILGVWTLWKHRNGCVLTIRVLVLLLLLEVLVWRLIFGFWLVQRSCPCLLPPS